jgi:hypothetical protein
MKAYSKAIAAFVGGAAVYLQTALDAGLTRQEIGAGILAGLVAGAAVYFAPANAPKR